MVIQLFMNILILAVFWSRTGHGTPPLTALSIAALTSGYSYVFDLDNYLQ